MVPAPKFGTESHRFGSYVQKLLGDYPQSCPDRLSPDSPNQRATAGSIGHGVSIKNEDFRKFPRVLFLLIEASIRIHYFKPSQLDGQRAIAYLEMKHIIIEH
jgi:hypothetical protein